MIYIFQRFLIETSFLFTLSWLIKELYVDSLCTLQHFSSLRANDIWTFLNENTVIFRMLNYHDCNQPCTSLNQPTASQKRFDHQSKSGEYLICYIEHFY